ncbi:MAG: PIN domain-containing protein [Puniceicoccaceae bacterium]|nr:MAG: PIN domain-containing protein [Puniceicoccaceae bacterium]
MLYLDTSAFLKLYVREAGSEAVQAMVAAQFEPLPVWEILEMELSNALNLKVFRGELQADESARQYSLFHQRQAKGFYFLPEIRRAELMADFRKLSGLTPRLGCRTMDIIHVACAMQLRPKAFLTFDYRQRELAKTTGVFEVPDLV